MALNETQLKQLADLHKGISDILTAASVVVPAPTPTTTATTTPTTAAPAPTPTPTPTPAPTGMTPNFNCALPIAPRITTARAVAPSIITQSGSYYCAANMPSVRIECDDVILDLSGRRVDTVTIGNTRACARMEIHNGTAGSVWCDRRPHTDLNVHHITFSGGSETSFFPSGQRIRLADCNVTAPSIYYAIFVGDITSNSDITIERCSFASNGDNSLVRICNFQRCVIRQCSFREPLYHHLRFHGYQIMSNDVHVEDCTFNGTGNGIGIAMDNDANGVRNLTFYRCNLAVGGPDRFNADRNRGGSHALDVRTIECQGDWS